MPALPVSLVPIYFSIIIIINLTVYQSDTFSVSYLRLPSCTSCKRGIFRIRCNKSNTLMAKLLVHALLEAKQILIPDCDVFCRELYGLRL